MVALQPRDIDFPGRDPEERFCFYFRQHWIRLLPAFLKITIGTIVLFLAGYVSIVVLGIDEPFVRRLIALLLCLFLVLLHINFIARFYRYFLYVIIVSDKKVHRIKKTLLAFDDHQSVALQGLQDIQRQQHGIVQNMFGFGSIILETQYSQLRIHFVPNVRDKYVTLMQLRGLATGQQQ